MLYVVVSVYAVTVKVGLLGNCWVVSSVLRSRRPRNRMGTLSPSDRLRSYIGLLAIIDLLVIASLFIRLIYLIFPHSEAEDMSCRAMFAIDRLVKLSSLTCLACISVERYITIRKPFSSRIRKRFIQFTPLVGLTVLLIVLSAVAYLASNVRANDGECVHMNTENIWIQISRWIVGISFLSQLLIVSLNYGQIVRHVRRKFFQRKARVVASARSATKQPLVSEPRYMRDMTTAIIRIACFHVVCWVPYCVMQLLPDTWGVDVDAGLARRVIEEGSQSPIRWLLWAAFVADWLSYLNSSADWILYAAMNKDLRSIIRATTERRKRSTMSQSSPPSNLHRSLRRHMAQSLRFFYSINSYRSNGNSFDDSMTTCQNANGSIDSHSSPMVVGRSVSSGVAAEGLFGMRNGRAHTYCSPRSSNGLSGVSIGSNGSRFVRSSPNASPKPTFSYLFASKDNCPEKFL